MIKIRGVTVAAKPWRRDVSQTDKKVKVQKYVCGNGKKDPKRSDNLRRHVKSVHEEEKGNTNKCKGCKKLFANKQNVLRHMKICSKLSSSTEQEEGEESKANVCEGCKKHFSNKQNVLRHMKSCKKL